MPIKSYLGKTFGGSAQPPLGIRRVNILLCHNQDLIWCDDCGITSWYLYMEESAEIGPLILWSVDFYIFDSLFHENLKLYQGIPTCRIIKII